MFALDVLRRPIILGRLMHGIENVTPYGVIVLQCTSRSRYWPTNPTPR